MMNTLRSWRKRLLTSSGSSPMTDGNRRSADEVRRHRASEVARLQADVHRLQHEISDLNDVIIAAGPTTVSRPNEARMASLHQQLAAKQRELGTHQARI